jgi:diguanylate cyclase (GGDEF)-like protein
VPDKSNKSRGFLVIIVIAMAAIGGCTYLAGAVPIWRSRADMAPAQIILLVLLSLLAMALGGIIAGIALQAAHQRGLELLRAERLFRQTASLDPLTKVLNRSSFLEAHAETARAAREGEPAALFVLDLDRLKEANDSYGHAMGDAMLRHVGSVLRWELEGAIIGRLGGDEFAFILPGLGSKTVCERIAGRVLRALKLPARLCSVVVEMSASIGISWTPEQTLDADEWMRYADLALYAAKTNGRGQVKCFEPELVARLLRRQMIERSLTTALSADDELEVYYQPIVAQSGASLHGVEALLRWRHPEHGFIPPSEFIPIAEEAGLIDRLGQLVFDRAFRDARSWPDLTLNVNVSPAQLRTHTFTPMLREKMAASGFPPDRLFLEITEGVLLECGEGQLSQINELRSIGVRISLDDFGSGYSSLAYVRDFPLDEIKIDRSYIFALPNDPRSGVVVSAICELGRGLNLLVIAEGVESDEHLALVKAAGCVCFQGYHFARPMPAASLLDYLRQWPKSDRSTRPESRLLGAA